MQYAIELIILDSMIYDGVKYTCVFRLKIFGFEINIGYSPFEWYVYFKLGKYDKYKEFSKCKN